jgi:hypothetical protein
VRERRIKKCLLIQVYKPTCRLCLSMTLYMCVLRLQSCFFLEFVLMTTYMERVLFEKLFLPTPWPSLLFPELTWWNCALERFKPCPSCSQPIRKRSRIQIQSSLAPKTLLFNNFELKKANFSKRYRVIPFTFYKYFFSKFQGNVYLKKYLEIIEMYKEKVKNDSWQ